MTPVSSTRSTTPTSPPSWRSAADPPTLPVAGTIWGLVKKPLSGARPYHGTPILWTPLPHCHVHRTTVWGGQQVLLTPAPPCMEQVAPLCLEQGRARGRAPTPPPTITPPATPLHAVPRLAPLCLEMTSLAPPGLPTILQVILLPTLHRILRVIPFTTTTRGLEAALYINVPISMAITGWTWVTKIMSCK